MKRQQVYWTVLSLLINGLIHQDSSEQNRRILYYIGKTNRKKIKIIWSETAYEEGKQTIRLYKIIQSNQVKQKSELYFQTKLCTAFYRQRVNQTYWGSFQLEEERKREIQIISLIRWNDGRKKKHTNAYNNNNVEFNENCLPSHNDSIWSANA